METKKIIVDENLVFLNRVIDSAMFFTHSLEVSKFIACQFALESDFGRSKLATEHFNYCGMKYPHRRFSYVSGRHGEFACYTCFEDCLLDYFMWIFYNRPYQNSLEFLDSFMLFLRDSGYCPEKDYISRIVTIYNKYFVSPQN